MALLQPLTLISSHVWPNSIKDMKQLDYIIQMPYLENTNILLENNMAVSCKSNWCGVFQIWSRAQPTSGNSSMCVYVCMYV